jgi:hypothetical protein
MINREKTIQKMIKRYREIFPIPGKKTLNECFFCLHGQAVIQFRTKDKKVHIAKACIEIQCEPGVRVQAPVLDSIRKFFNQPIRLGFLTR